MDSSIKSSLNITFDLVIKCFYILSVSFFVVLKADKDGISLEKIEETILEGTETISPRVTSHIIKTLYDVEVPLFNSVLDEADEKMGSTKRSQNRLTELMNLLNFSKFPSKRCESPDRIKDLKDMRITLKYPFNVVHYIDQYYLNQVIRCSYDFEQDLQAAKLDLYDPDKLIKLVSFIELSEECKKSERHPRKLIYFDLASTAIPKSCLIDGFAAFILSRDPEASKHIKPNRVRAQLDEIMSKLKHMKQVLTDYRKKYFDFLYLEPQFIEYNGYQTTGLMSLSGLADKRNLDNLISYADDITKAIRSGTANKLRAQLD